jgi:hypothetical protein
VGSFHETCEFGGRKKSDVARSPPSNDHGLLLVHNLIENASQIFTKAGVCRFTRHEVPKEYRTAFLYGRARLHCAYAGFPPAFAAGFAA